MVAGGLIKALTVASFEAFVRMIGIEDKMDLLPLIKKKENLKEVIQQHRTGL